MIERITEPLAGWYPYYCTECEEVRWFQGDKDQNLKSWRFKHLIECGE